MSNVVSGYRIVGGTMAAGDLLLLLCDHIEVTNMGGGIDGWIPPPTSVVTCLWFMHWLFVRTQHT
jgi:hypothetical protein